MTRRDHAARPRLGLATGLLLFGLSGCVQMDDSPSMQAELRSAKAELVEATRELREVTADLKLLQAKMEKSANALGESRDVLAMADRFATAESSIKCSASNRCKAPAKLLEEVLGDEAKLRKQARLRTVREKGKITGFRVDQVKEGSLADLLGFQRQDEIKRVGGVTLNKMGVFKDVLKKLKGQKSITVLYERSGRSINLRIDFK